MYHLIVDFKGAYDSIYRDKLFKAMEEFAIPTKLISLTKITLMQGQNTKQSISTFCYRKRLEAG
jgi:hypothetical protein